MEVELLVDEVSLTVDPEAGGWEAAANTRIERVRKRNLTVSVGTRTGSRAVNEPSQSFRIKEKAPIRAFSLLKAPTNA